MSTARALCSRLASSPLLAIALCSAVLWPASGEAQVPPGALLVLSKGDLTLAVVDPTTLQVLARVPSGPDPHEVVASADGRLAFIANYHGGDNVISVIDLEAMKPLTPIDLGPLRAPHGLAFVAGKLWFTAEGAKAIGSYDPAAHRVDWVLGTGQDRTHMIYVWDDLTRMATSNVSSGTVTLIEQRPFAAPGGGRVVDWEETVVPVGSGSEGFDVSPDGKELWVANAGAGTISIIDVPAKKVTETVAADVTGANRLKFTPDGRLVFVSTLRGSDVTVLDGATRRVVKRVPVGKGAAGIQMQPDGQRAYVSCTPDDYVAVIDVSSLAVAGRIEAGRQPDGLAWVVRQH
jgi:YVTN family beta-propeller protein